MKRKIAAMLVMAMALSATSVPMTFAAETTAEASESAFHADVVQHIKNGDIKGSLVNEDKTLLWTGVPYAAAPVGELRWKAPQDHEDWEGVFDATQDGNLGVQVSGGNVIGDEDCLNMDIYRPNTDDTNLPVLVYIHGGNNQTGTSKEIPFEKLAANANCVVVCLNYRLGCLGFNSLPALKTGDDLENSGNFTLLDFAKALDWIAENGEALGANPQNITISGFSAGGRDVMAMLISPIFEGKFQKAISFSGGMTVADVEDSQKVTARAIAPLVVEDGVKENEEDAIAWLLSDDEADKEEVRTYLYGVEAGRLAGIMTNAGIRMSVFPHLFADGVVLPEEGFETTEYNDVPLIMLTGSSEFSIFALGDKYFADAGDLVDGERSAEYKFAMNYGSELYGLFNAEESAVKMVDKYDAPIYTCDIDFGTDEEIVGKQQANLIGASHGVFIPFLSGIAAGSAAGDGSAYEYAGPKELTEKFQSYISNFLWTGDPNGEGLETWKAWTGAEEGPSQLLLDADKEKAIITMSTDRVSYDEILDRMEADDTISEEAKSQIISEVLNGRWFSAGLDERFGNRNLWE
ncbi:MAG: carboxylesterase family protein [Lachnospiraceae bacterium]|nr:carboxylesterase family protein [Robinsoniella sp.]MDY3765165.1 carboxylesterase family protein [Lachnospiraceae bacterium]